MRTFNNITSCAREFVRPVKVQTFPIYMDFLVTKPNPLAWKRWIYPYICCMYGCVTFPLEEYLKIFHSIKIWAVFFINIFVELHKLSSCQAARLQQNQAALEVLTTSAYRIVADAQVWPWKIWEPIQNLSNDFSEHTVSVPLASSWCPYFHIPVELIYSNSNSDRISFNWKSK